MKIPEYLTLFCGNSRLRTCHLDRLSFESSILPRGKTCDTLKKSFYYRTHLAWNDLPLELREVGCLLTFKRRLNEHLWAVSFSELSNSIPDSVGVT